VRQYCTQDIYLFGEKVLSSNSFNMADRSMHTQSINIAGFTPCSRVFALEFQQSDFVIRPGESIPASLITPTGERIFRFYSCGALTEMNRGGKTGGSVRVADPTGVLVLHFRSRSPEIASILDTLSIPAFVSVIGSVEPDSTPGEGGFRLHLEMIALSDRAFRDRWIIRTADITLKRLDNLSRALSGEPGSEETRKALARYRTNPRQLRFLAGMVEKALSQVQASPPADQEKTGTEDQVPAPDTQEKVVNLIREISGPRGISVQELTVSAEKAGIGQSLLMEIIRALIAEDELYQPSAGFVKIL
jgi:RPA family protein